MNTTARVLAQQIERNGPSPAEPADDLPADVPGTLSTRAAAQFCLEGRSRPETARELGSPEGTVRSRIRRRREREATRGS